MCEMWHLRVLHHEEQRGARRTKDLKKKSGGILKIKIILGSLKNEI